jgi:N-acetylglucosaminyldiphosphoundecaprenol N-acetyl-beta-D-mannosaminyltransferase
MNEDIKRFSKRVIELDIDVISYLNARNRIIENAKSRQKGYVCFANVHMLIEAHLDKSFATQVNNAALVLPDGMPLVKTLGSFYNIRQERVAGMDMLPDLIEQAAKENLRVFFFGSTSQVLERVNYKIKTQYPNMQIELLSPPFEKSLDDQLYIDTITKIEPHLVFVALGCPKQEKWMAVNSKKINAVLLGVGGAFPVYAGMAERAPAWIRNASLEWLFRLCQEPRRLFKRYLITNTLFICIVLKIKIKILIERVKTRRAS